MTAQTGHRKTRGRPRSGGPDRPAATVQALDRALGLLRSLAKTDEATLTELALRTGMPPSTAHRLLMTMQRHDIVGFDESTQHWMVAVEAFRIGSSFARRTNVVQAGRAVMRALMEATGETANIGIIADGDVVFISQIETPRTIRAFFRPGTRGPMHASGIGKALLAELPREEVERILQTKGLPSFTPGTLTSPGDLHADLERTRTRGWSIDNEERNIGMRCLAAAIFNEHGEAVAGISISGPAARMSDEKLGEFGPLVKRAARKVTEAIGGKMPPRPNR